MILGPSSGRDCEGSTGKKRKKRPAPKRPEPRKRPAPRPRPRSRPPARAKARKAARKAPRPATPREKAAQARAKAARAEKARRAKISKALKRHHKLRPERKANKLLRKLAKASAAEEKKKAKAARKKLEKKRKPRVGKRVLWEGEEFAFLLRDNQESEINPLLGDAMAEGFFTFEALFRFDLQVDDEGEEVEPDFDGEGSPLEQEGDQMATVHDGISHFTAEGPTAEAFWAAYHAAARRFIKLMSGKDGSPLGAFIVERLRY